MSSSYNGVIPLGCVVISFVGTRTLLRPRQKLIQLCCQLSLMLAERSQGLPSSIGYAPGASSASTTTEMSKRWPPMMMPNFWIKPNFRQWVSAMQSQKGQASHSESPNYLHVFALITLTPEPPSIIQPVISWPCSTSLMAGLWWSTIIGSSLVSTKISGDTYARSARYAIFYGLAEPWN